MANQADTDKAFEKLNKNAGIGRSERRQLFLKAGGGKLGSVAMGGAEIEIFDDEGYSTLFFVGLCTPCPSQFVKEGRFEFFKEAVKFDDNKGYDELKAYCRDNKSALSTGKMHFEINYISAGGYNLVRNAKVLAGKLASRTGYGTEPLYFGPQSMELQLNWG